MKFDRFADAIEWTKEPHQYTFHPDTTKSARSKQTALMQNTYREEDQEQADDQEFVYIDIDLGKGANSKERVTLFKNSCPETLAKDFAAKHGLNMKLEQKLA